MIGKAYRMSGKPVIMITYRVGTEIWQRVRINGVVKFDGVIDFAAVA